MPAPLLMGYSVETVIAEKIETIVQRGMINTRMKDFYDLWTILGKEIFSREQLAHAINSVFSNRGTDLRYPSAFTAKFFENEQIKKRWKTFLAGLGEEQIELSEVTTFISSQLGPFFPNDPHQM